MAERQTASGSPARHAIEVASLEKSFGEIEAVRGVSFDVAPGEVFGFLGPNGAGKTTTISMLCTLVRPTGGTARTLPSGAGHPRDDGKAP